MTDEHLGNLKDLQNLDRLLEETRQKISEFGPLLADIEEPALALEQEAATLRTRVQEMKLEERRLEHSADDRRIRWKMLRERLKAVRTLREEAAVQAEQDLVRAALEGDEQEALTLLDQIRKMEIRLDELEIARDAARAEVEPRRIELLAEQKGALDGFAQLKEEREGFATRVPAGQLQHYERIRGGGRTVAVAALTPDGACGHCFGVIPIQVQNEIRKGRKLLLCEACGVLLSPGEDDL